MMPQSAKDTNIGFLIGPLTKRNPDKIANRLFRMLDAIGIKCTDVAMISVNVHSGFARVQLHSTTTEDYAIKAFKDIRSLLNMYDLRRLTDRPITLQVERIEKKRIRKSANSPKQPRSDQDPKFDTSMTNYTLVNSEKEPVLFKSTGRTKPMTRRKGGTSGSRRDSKDGPLSAAQREQTYDIVSLSTESSDSTPPLTAFQKLEEDDDDLSDLAVSSPSKRRPTKIRSTQTSLRTSTSSETQSTSGSSSTKRTSRVASVEIYRGKIVGANNSSMTSRADDSQSEDISATDSSIGQPLKANANIATDDERCWNSQGPGFYHRGQKVETSRRGHTLFDNGNMLINDLRAFRKFLGKRVCACLNSPGGGTLYFGVNPTEGVVEGLPINHRVEDALRVDMDRQIKDIYPTVPMSAYKLNFVKVMSENGHLVPDLKVVQVDIVSPRHSPTSSMRVDLEEISPSAEHISGGNEGYAYRDECFILRNDRVVLARRN